MPFTDKNYIAPILVCSALILSLIFHYSIFNKDITGVHTWRQAQTQLNIRNFYRKDPNILNTRVAHFNGGKDNLYRYEFPMMQWSIAMLQKVFGEDISVTRISVFFIGLFTLLAFGLLIYKIFRNPILAALGVWCFNFSPVFFYYTVNPLPDNLALCAGMFYLYFAIKNYRKERLGNHLLAALFISLATLSKLPFIVFGAVTFVFFLQKWSAMKFRINSKLLLTSSIYILMLFPAFLWYRWVMPGWEGNGILHGIFEGDNSWGNILRILKYHIKVMFPKILLNPVSLIFILSGLIIFIRNRDFIKKQSLALGAAFLMTILYFFLEINMIDTIHDYYMLPFLPFLYLWVLYGINWALSLGGSFRYLSTFIIIIMPWQCLQENKDKWSPEFSGFNTAIFYHQEDLMNAVPADKRCIVLNDRSYFAFLYKFDKEGYVFKDDYLPVEWVDDLRLNHGVYYMYSDSRKVDESPEMKKRIDSLIIERGSVKVFKLKGQ